MATRSTIMDTNSFRPEMAAALDSETRRLTEERDVLGPAYRLFYRTPLISPLRHAARTES